MPVQKNVEPGCSNVEDPQEPPSTRAGSSSNVRSCAARRGHVSATRVLQTTAGDGAHRAGAASENCERQSSRVAAVCDYT